MRRTLLCAGFLTLLFVLLLSAASFAQTPSPDPQPTPDAQPTPQPRNDDIDERTPPAPADPTAAPATPQSLDGDNDSADVPAFALPLVDSETYMRMRDEHIRFLRGLMDKKLDPRARGNSIRRMKDHEYRLKNSAPAPTSTDTSTPSGPSAPNNGSNLLSTTPPSSLAPWTALGPAPIPNGQTTTISTPVSGRVTTIAVHPTNENIVYVGTAQGGLYRSLNGGASWTALMDDAQSLAIGSIAIDPLDPTTIFVGTGEGNLSADSFFGVGLYIIKSADTVPTLLGPFNLDNNGIDVFTGRSITKVLVSPTDDNIVFVATTSGIGGISADSIPSVILNNLPSRGLYRSTNAMSATPTFTKITVQPAAGGNRGITDIVFGATPNILLAGVNGLSTGGNDGGIWRTTNAFDPVPTFTNQVVVGTPTATIQIKMASNTVNGVTTILAATGEPPATTPAAPGNGSNCGAPGWVRRSTDGGVTFGLGLIQTSGFCNTQCFYDMAPAMDPTNSNIFYLGGSANADTNPPRNTCRSNVLTRTLDGTNFTRIDTGLHADTHAVTVAPSNPNVVYFGSDGGVWRSSNGGGTWQSINNAGFNATQFQSIALHPSDRNFSIGGTQDNGTPFFQPDATWTRADFGDGGFALIDQSATDTTNVTMYHTYFNQTNNLIGFGRVLTTANAHDNGWAFLGCQGAANNNGIVCSNAVLFYAPMTLGPGTPNTLYFGTDRLYRSVNRGSTMTVVSQAPFQAGQPVSSIGISPQNDNIRIVGLRSGRIFATTTGATTFNNITNAGMPAKYVSRAVIDPNNSNTAYATFAGFGIAGSQVWKTTNLAGGANTWVAAATGLPDVPVSGFAIDPVNSNMLYAGTDIGVYLSRDGGNNWAPFGTGLPRVAVFDIAVQNANRIVRIATHGRGAWEIPAAKTVALVTLAAPASATYGNNVTFTASVAANGALATPGGTVTFSDGGQTLGTATLDNTLQASFSTSLLTAGSHSIVATFNGDRIFDVSPSQSFAITITPAGLVITADNKTKILNAPNPALTATYSGFVLGQGPDSLTGVLTCTTTALTNSFVGSYPITCSGQTSSNYVITYVPGTLTIIFASGGLVDGEPSHVVLSPVAADGSSVFNARRTVPIKFRVGDVNGASIGTPGVVTGFRIIQVISGAGSNVVDLPVDSRTPDAAFRWDPTAQQWIFNLDTSGLSAGSTYVFRISLADGTHIDFQFGLR